MADENKPAFYPRVGKTKAKNFKSAQPKPFLDDPRAMDLPSFGDLDLSVPSKSNLEMSRRIAQRDADLKRQLDADMSPLEKVAGGMQAGRFLGSALTQAVASIPTAITKGGKAAEDYIAENVYKPNQPKGLEYAQDVGDFLERLETEYKLPAVATGDVLGFTPLIQAGASQAARQIPKAAMRGAQALEQRLDPMVTQALERGGLQRDLLTGLAQGSRSNVIKPKGGNWLSGKDVLTTPETNLSRLKRDTAGGNDPAEMLRQMRERYTPEALANMQEGSRANIAENFAQLERDVALNNWIDSNLTNYVKKQMATPEDPVRKLAEEGIIHTTLRDEPERLAHIRAIRQAEGFPAEGMGKSDLAKQWENLTDDSIRITKAGRIQDAANVSERLDTAKTEMDAYKKKLDQDFLARMSDATGQEIFSPKEAEMLLNMPYSQKAEILGDKNFQGVQNNLYELMARLNGFEKRAGELNPFVSKLDPETRLYSGTTHELGFDHIMDVLREDIAAGRIRPEQLNKVSMEQAVRRTYEYDQELAKKMAEARLTARAELPVHKDYPEEGYRWVQLTRPGDFAAESEAMGHSVRGYEPPKGSPDWAEGSGDSGYSGYGLGGWDAIKSGKAKVYSLLDSKGEPHVTIEVGAYPNQLRAGNLKPYTQAALEEAKLLPNGYTDADVRDIEIRMARENMPKYINQIKGKQNAAPKEDYLPYVQDFVRGGNWSDVRDFQNTGLARLQENSDLAKWLQEKQIELPKYPTKQELNRHEADFLLEKLGPKEFDELGLGYLKGEEGMKRGGKVSISSNPDTMMLEVNNQKMKNGVPAYGGAGAVTKKGLKAVKSEVPRLAMQFGNDLPLNMNAAEVENLAKRFPEPVVDRINMAHKDVLKRTPELQEAAARIEAGDMSADEYARLVQRHKPVTPYESVPAPASREEILAALAKTSREAEGLPRKETYFGRASSTLKEGDPVGLRLDIPSYNQANTWVVTAHGPRKSPVSGGAGTRIGYEPVAMATDVDFSVSPKAALGIAKGAEKNTIATMEGKWKPTNPDEAFTLAKQYLKNPEWRQVGMDPERHSFFYDRETMAPVVNAEEVIQIGPLVLAKNPKYGNPKDFKYASGGLAQASEPHYAGAGAVVKQALKAGRMSRADAEAAGLYHPVSLGVKLRRPVSEIDFKAIPNPDQPMVPERKVSPEALFKGAGIPYIGDSSRAGELITEIAGKKLETPVELQGGMNWMRVNTFKDKPNKSSSWASGTSVISDLNKKARIAAEQADDVYGLHTSMSPSGADFSSMPTKVLLAQFDPKAHDPVILDALDEEIRKLKPKFVGVRSPDLEKQLLGPGGGEMRKAFVTRLALKPFQDAGLPNVAEARYMVSHPELLERPVGTVGGTIAKVDPRGTVIEDPLNVHYDYPTKQGGEYFAGFDVPMTTQEVFPEFFENRRAFNADKAGDRRAFDLSTPIQVFDQKWLDEIMPIYLKRRQELIGKKKGGVVKKAGGAVDKPAEGGKLPAAYINGDEFVNAAKKYGIKDSMNNLNKIVDLVNKGLSVDDAARQVADSGMHKAAGGAISGDDLILEERPL